MKALLITSGEPAGIGPDICLNLAGYPYSLVVLGDINLFRERAYRLGLNVNLKTFEQNLICTPEPNTLWIWHVPVNAPVQAGVLESQNSMYVLELLRLGAEACLKKQFSALVTAPVHKGIINDAGIPFSGHTEYFADACGAAEVVMLLVCPVMKVALVTTHLPLSQVSAAITPEHLSNIIQQVHLGMQTLFGLSSPRILVAGLNPHAGEGGHLGREEVEVIEPVISAMSAQGYNVTGPLPADTLFTPPFLKEADVILAMYHDQGLSVLKYAGFGQAVNVTLGLPIIRTSVDHGTALTIAGTGKARASSLQAAVNLAVELIDKRAR